MTNMNTSPQPQKRRGPKKRLVGGKKRQIWIANTDYAWLKQIGDGNARLGLSLYLAAKDKFEVKNHGS